MSEPLLDMNTAMIADANVNTDANADTHMGMPINHNTVIDAKTDAKTPPAVAVPLTGKYLIEASAGTGKTWTLTGIVLRLLIEAKRPPEHIIATTFTRAAAAEMRDRIHKRLVDFHHLLQWLISLQARPAARDTLYPYLADQTQTLSQLADQEESDKKARNKQLRDSITDEQRTTRADLIQDNASLTGMSALIDDPINWHLTEYLLDRAIEYPIDQALRRTKLVLTTLDKLFVGTLDSLAQKWLSEYSAETGHQPGMQISMDEDLMVTSIIHDTVRGFYSRIYSDKPQTYAQLQSTNRLTEPSDHKGVADKSLQFISIPINPVAMPDDVDMAGFTQALDDFKNNDLSDIEPYFDADFRLAQGMDKRAVINTKFESIVDIKRSIEQSGSTFFGHLDDNAASLFATFPEAFLSKSDGGKGFSVKNETERLAFINLPTIQQLYRLYEYVKSVEQHLDALIDKLNYDIAINVRQKLPAMLEVKNETTFTLQMVRLNQALSGRRGAQLARYIRHHYPVALIDESQDINGEQAHMIEQIYLAKPQSDDDNKNNKKRHTGFLLLVGDPKQAIYGFRGGDVTNFNAIKAKFDRRHIMTLDINRRSSAPLITALNHWFGRGQAASDTDKNKPNNALANLGSQIYYQHITAAKTKPNASWQLPPDLQTVKNKAADALFSDHPVAVLHLPKDSTDACNEYQLTARHIQAVLASHQSVDGRPLQPSDIGVLGKNKNGLKQVENELVKLGVPTLQTAEVNIFTTKMAEDLAALLDAMLRPHQRDRVNRVLTSSFYQKSLKQVQALIKAMDNENSATGSYPSDASRAPSYQDFQNHLKYAATLWQSRGILTALHFLFNHDPMQAHVDDQHPLQTKVHEKQPHKASLWVALTRLKDSTRHLMDLRHLLDILAMFGMHIGEHELLAWFRQQMRATTTPDWARQQPLPTTSGVQLMTIHKSKGLEFPIVYVIDIDSASKSVSQKTKNHLFLYGKTDDNHIMTRHLSIRAGEISHSAQQKDKDDYAKLQTDEQYDEYRRLIYVALTRASSQLYMVLKDSGRRSQEHLRPVAHWLGSESIKLEPPERLQPYIGWLNAEHVLTHIDSMSADITPAINTSDAAIDNTQDYIDYTPAYHELNQQFFRGWAKTSFTALSRRLNSEERAQAVNDDSMEEALDIKGYASLADTAIDSTHSQIAANSDAVLDKDDIRFRFIKGANAGTFLHDIFEKIDFHDHNRWSATIDQAIRAYQLPSNYASLDYQQREYDAMLAPEHQNTTAQSSAMSITQAPDHEALMAWIADVLATPLLASQQPLSALDTDKRIAELSFNMGLSERFDVEQISDVFRRHLPDASDKHISLDAQGRAYIYRYLRGEIDLVYEHAGKYYVVDYKSNYLGDQLSDYNQANLSAAMSHAGYWLQAAIYQVALHRFLKLRLAGYAGNEDKYLGAVEYVFLRGIGNNSESTSANKVNEDQGFGRIAWDIPIELIRALDTMFGTPKL